MRRYVDERMFTQNTLRVA